MLIWVLLIVPILLIFIYLNIVNQYWENNKVPNVKSWLFFGNMGPLIFRLKSMADIIQEIYSSHDSRYVGTFTFITPVLIIKDLNLLKTIGIKYFDHFTDHRQTVGEEMDPLFGRILFSLRGEKWRNMRGTLSPAFTSKKMREIFSLMTKYTQEFTNYFTELVDPNEPMTLELKDVFSRFASDIIASTAFGIECNSLKDKKNDFFVSGKQMTSFGTLKTLKFFSYSTFPYVMEKLQIRFIPKKFSNYFGSIIFRNIKNRVEQKIIRHDMIHLLLEARKEKLKVGDSDRIEDTGSEVQKLKPKMSEYLTDTDILAQAIVFFFAGSDTISTAMCHVLYELALHEDIQEKLQKEIDETLDECNGEIDYDRLVKMRYLDMVLSEGLRKWPSIPAIDRCCTKNFVIQPEDPGEVPVTLKKGDVVLFPMYSIQRDPKYFSDPQKFDPERFNEENRAKIPPLSYIPFGIGPRSCIASRFAVLEIKTMMFHMLSKFSFVVIPKTEIPITIIKTSFRMTAANGFWLGLKRRNKQ